MAVWLWPAAHPAQSSASFVSASMTTEIKHDACTTALPETSPSATATEPATNAFGFPLAPPPVIDIGLRAGDLLMRSAGRGPRFALVVRRDATGFCVAHYVETHTLNATARTDGAPKPSAACLDLWSAPLHFPLRDKPSSGTTDFCLELDGTVRCPRLGTVQDRWFYVPPWLKCLP